MLVVKYHSIILFNNKIHNYSDFRVIMGSGLLIYGTSGNGKTYTTRILAKDFGLTKIEFDHVINFVTELVRNKFGKADPKMDIRNHFIKRMFKTDKELVAFKNACDVLVNKNHDFFKEFYEKCVKDKKPTIYYKLQSDRSSCVDLGKNGMFLKTLVDDIMNLVFRYLIKNSSFFVMEGYYFKVDSFRESVRKKCDDLNYLECFYKDRKNSFIYKFNEKDLKDLDELKTEVKKIIRKRPSYQIFSEKGIGDSKSIEKLQKLGIPDDLQGKNVLDLGCNEGFYCFECEKRGAKCVGIERDPYWFNEALKRKNERSSFVNFINDGWDYLPSLNHKFDLALFLAAFHYIKDNQLEVLTNIYNRLSNNGVLILEIGLLNKDEENFLIESVKRPAGDICQFTNKFTIKKLLKDAGFQNVEFFGKGWDMRGDDVPRYVIHAKRIDGKNFSVLEKAENKKPDNQIKKSDSDLPEDKEIVNVLVNAYNKNRFYKIILKLGYKILKRNSK